MFESESVDRFVNIYIDLVIWPKNHEKLFPKEKIGKNFCKNWCVKKWREQKLKKVYVRNSHVGLPLSELLQHFEDLDELILNIYI